MHIYYYIQVLARITSLERQEQGSKNITRDYKSIGSKKKKERCTKQTCTVFRRLGALARRLEKPSGITKLTGSDVW